MHHRTHDGRAFPTLNILDEFTRETLAIRVRRKPSSVDVIDVLTDLFIMRGPPGPYPLRQRPGVRRRDWTAAVGARTTVIEPGLPWENGYIESFNARLRDELQNGEVFYTLTAAQVLIESMRRHYNAIRPTWQPGIPAAGPGNDRLAMLAARLRCAPPVPQLGGETLHALTFNLDQSPRAGHDWVGRHSGPGMIKGGNHPERDCHGGAHIRSRYGYGLGIACCYWTAGHVESTACN